MANTTQNRASVSAQFLRGAVSDLKRVERRVDDTAANIRSNALAQIEGVAEEYESVTPEGDAAVLAALDALVLDDNVLGEVTISSSKTEGVRVVLLYLGHSPLPCGIGSDVRGAIQHAAAQLTAPDPDGGAQ